MRYTLQDTTLGGLHSKPLTRTGQRGAHTQRHSTHTEAQHTERDSTSTEIERVRERQHTHTERETIHTHRERGTAHIHTTHR